MATMKVPVAETAAITILASLRPPDEEQAPVDQHHSAGNEDRDRGLKRARVNERHGEEVRDLPGTLPARLALRPWR